MLSPAERFAYARQLPSAPDQRSELARYGRMIRPFPIKRLSDALYHVQADAATLAAILLKLQIDPPQRADVWCEALYHLEDVLLSIAERAADVRPVLGEMIDRSDAEEERALVALRALTDLEV